MYFFCEIGALSGRSTSIGIGHDCTKTLDEKFNDFSKLSRQGSLENFGDYSKLSRQGSLGKFRLTEFDEKLIMKSIIH
jgi:hypothetical protein